jgi:hypothetical protein
MEKERRHFSIFWPVLLITVGIVLFLNNTGTISGDTWDVIWNLWPLLFIIGGIDGLVNRSGFAGPVVGIGLGTIFLLGNFGYLPVPAFEVLIKFWPVLLIACSGAAARRNADRRDLLFGDVQPVVCHCQPDPAGEP